MARVTTITLDGKRIPIDAKVPRRDVSWLVNRLHVGTPDTTIEADISKRCHAPDGTLVMGYTPTIVKQTVAYALYCHRKNQNLVRKFAL